MQADWITAAGVVAEQAGGLQRPGDLCAARQTHVDHECQAAARQRVPTRSGAIRLCMTGHECHARRVTPVRHRDAGGSGRRDPSRDAGDDLDIEASSMQRVHLLATASEDERIASLEPDDATA